MTEKERLEKIYAAGPAIEKGFNDLMDEHERRMKPLRFVANIWAAVPVLIPIAIVTGFLLAAWLDD